MVKNILIRGQKHFNLGTPIRRQVYLRIIEGKIENNFQNDKTDWTVKAN